MYVLAKLFCYGCQSEFDKSEVIIEEGIKNKVWICTNCFKSEDMVDDIEDEE